MGVLEHALRRKLILGRANTKSLTPPPIVDTLRGTLAVLHGDIRGLPEDRDIRARGISPCLSF